MIPAKTRRPRPSGTAGPLDAQEIAVQLQPMILWSTRLDHLSAQEIAVRLQLADLLANLHGRSRTLRLSNNGRKAVRQPRIGRDVQKRFASRDANAKLCHGSGAWPGKDDRPLCQGGDSPVGTWEAVKQQLFPHKAPTIPRRQTHEPGALHLAVQHAKYRAFASRVACRKETGDLANCRRQIGCQCS